MKDFDHANKELRIRSLQPLVYEFVVVLGKIER